MKFLGYILIASVFFGEAAGAGQTNFGVSSESAAWLGLPNSARTAGMGGASVALAGDVNAVSVNPAALGSLGGQQLSLLYNSYDQDMSYEHAAYGLGLGESDGVAVSADYMDYGAIAAYSPQNGILEQNGSINPYGFAANLGYGHAFGGFLVGATGELVSETLAGEDSNSALAADLGAIWQAGAMGLSAGLAVQNLGGKLGGADLPTQYQGGLSYKLPLFNGLQGLTVAGDVELPAAETNADSLSLGAEYSGGSLWSVRAGYNFAGNNGISGLSVGGGLNYGVLGIDYAFVTEGVLGDANLISLNARFPSMGDSDADARKTLAPAEISKANTPAANAETATAQIEAPPDSLNLKFSVPVDHLDSAHDLDAHGDYKDAIREYQLALKDRPGDPAIWRSMGTSYLNVGRKDYALQCYQVSLRLDPAQPDLVLQLQTIQGH